MSDDLAPYTKETELRYGMKRYKLKGKNDSLRYFFVDCWTFISVFLICVCVYAQTFNVKGRISTRSGPAKFARVIYVDRLDTARHYTAITDTSRDYQLGLLTSVLAGGKMRCGYAGKQPVSRENVSVR